MVLAPFGVQAQQTEPTQEAKVSNFHLDLVLVADATPTQFFWRVDGLPGFVFKSLDSEFLRKWVADLPANSVIEYSPSDALIPGQPSGEDVERFKAFCKAEKVTFIQHLSG